MKIIKKKNNLILIKLKKFKDSRGEFFELYNKKKYQAIGIKEEYKQSNTSISNKNVLRGLHYAVKKPQSQIVTILQGKIFDVLVDLRKKSKYFGRAYSFTLSANYINQIYMPKGFAHGFYVMSDTVKLNYNVSEIYDPNDENGILWNDKKLKINWPCKKPIISCRDKKYFSLDNIDDKKLPNLK